MQRDLGPGIAQSRIRFGGHKQEHLTAQPPCPHARDVHEQLVAAKAEGPDDPAWERVLRQVPGPYARRRNRRLVTHRTSTAQSPSRPPTIPPTRSPRPWRWALPPLPSATGGWK